MKTFYTFFLFLSVISVSVFAQPSLTSSWVPTTGLSYRVTAMSTATALSEGTAGASQTWNLAGYDTTVSQNAVYVNPATAPQSSSFPGATDCLEGLSTAGNNSYEYNKLNGSVYQLMGLVQPTPNSYVAHYTDPQDIVHFPATYSSTFTDHAEVAITFVSAGMSGTKTQNTTETVTADGYGTLITKAGTFTNTLRFHVVQDILDSTFYNGQTIAYVYHYDTYNWMSPTVHGIILASISHLITNGGSPTDHGSFSRVSGTNGIESLTAAGISDWSLAPMPCADHATITINCDKAAGDATIAITDMSGRQMNEVSAELAADKNEIGLDISSLADGIYILSLRVGGRMDTRKLAVRH